MRYVNDQSLFYVLPARIVCVKCLTDRLLRSQYSLRLDSIIGGLATDYLEIDVGRVDVSSERVCVLVQNDISNVVDQIIFIDGNTCS